MVNFDTNFDVIVVGGGASGLMAAGRAAERGKKVLLLEKNRRLGEKLKISGGGRCNITNAEFDEHIFLKNYGEAEQFLYSPFSQFGVKNTFSFFEGRGLPLVIEARKRVFPNTQKASDVFAVLEKYINEGNVLLKTSSSVSRILFEKVQESNKEKIKITGVISGGREYKARSYIFATGGLSHPETGSTGDGFNWLAELGHGVSDPNPNIVPLAVKEKWVKELSGVSLSFMKITFYLDEIKQFSKTGKILFTHFGLSGPLILNSARKVGELLKKGNVTGKIDAFPHTDPGSLDHAFVVFLDKNKNKALKNAFRDFAPAGTAESILSILSAEIDPETKVHSVTKEQRKRISYLLKALPVTITGLMGFDRAVISDGGVSLTEIDTKTMRSKKVENLYVTGDLLNINRPSGGYSLQLCWTSGYVAGSNI